MEWISVKDRLPEFHNKTSILSLEVLIYAVYNDRPDLPGILDVSSWSVRLKGWVRKTNLKETWEDYGYTVTHWMPLPDPPKFED